MKKHWVPTILIMVLLVLALAIIDEGNAAVDVRAAPAAGLERAPAATLVVTSTADSGVGTLRKALLDAGIHFESVELTMTPTTTIRLEDKQTLQIMGVIDGLEELDDVQHVHSNLEISDEAMAKYEAAH